MRTFTLAAFAAIALSTAAPSFAQPHDHSGHHAQDAGVRTTPGDGAMGPAPRTFSAAFDHPMRLTALVITPRGGDPIAVNVPAATPSNAVSIALPALAPGNYVFAWTATGADNHTMTGRVRYMVH